MVRTDFLTSNSSKLDCGTSCPVFPDDPGGLQSSIRTTGPIGYIPQPVTGSPDVAN
jgi:hypothetical protein